MLFTRKNFLVVRIRFYYGMFDFRELQLMFIDPTDLVINNINKFLGRNKVIKFIFS